MCKNGRWSASFEVSKTGFYHYTVTGWVDHASTWHHGFLKKYQDGQHLDVELLIGADLLQWMLSAASKADQKKINALVTLMRDDKKYEQAINAVLAKEMHQLIELYPNLKNATTYA